MGCPVSPTAVMAASPRELTIAVPTTEIKEISTYISHKNGGRGAVRDVIEQVMKVQGKWSKHFDGQHD